MQTQQELSGLKLKTLKDICRDKHLPISGLKKDLIYRKINCIVLFMH